MANYRNDFADVNLETGTICRNFMNHSIGSGDALGDRFGVRVFRNGEPVSLGGTCAGYFVRNTTGETVVISSGVVSGNEAYITLPAACYAVEGSFTLAIKVTSGSETVTMRIIDGVVSRTNTSVTVDPGTLVPSIETLISAINSAVGQIPVNYNASFAPAYSASSTYAVGDYVVYDGYLWRCTTAITETESWTAAHWTKVALASDVSDLKSALTKTDDDFRSFAYALGYMFTIQTTAWAWYQADIPYGTTLVLKTVNGANYSGSLMLYKSDKSTQIGSTLAPTASGDTATITLNFNDIGYIRAYNNFTNPVYVYKVITGYNAKEKIDNLMYEQGISNSELLNIPQIVNLFDKSKIAAGYINSANGGVGNGYYHTDYIPVRAGVTYYVSLISESMFALYDTHKTYISPVTNVNDGYNLWHFTPTYDGYFRGTLTFNTDAKLSVVYVTPYGHYFRAYDPKVDYSYSSEKLNGIANNSAIGGDTSNLFIGGSNYGDMNVSTGVPSYNESAITSPFIAIQDVVWWSLLNDKQVLLGSIEEYDANKDWIKHNSVTVPIGRLALQSSTRYIRISSQNILNEDPAITPVIFDESIYITDSLLKLNKFISNRKNVTPSVTGWDFFANDVSFRHSYVEDAVKPYDNTVNMGGYDFVMPLVTDIHLWGYNSDAYNMHRYMSETGTADICVNLGDNIIDHTTTKEESIEQLKACVLWSHSPYKKCPMLILRGNHDNNPQSNNDKTKMIMDSDYFAIVQSRTIKGYAGTNKNYGFIDFEQSKVRLIFLDAGDIYDEDGEPITNGMNVFVNQEQLTWFCQKALNFMDKPDRAEWSVISVCHAELRQVNETAFNAVLKAFIDGSTAQGSYTVTFADTGNTVDISYNVDFTAQGAMDYVCHANGHTHRDYAFLMGDTGKYDIGICCDLPTGGTYIENGEVKTYTRTAGTILQRCMDTLCLDKANRKVYMKRLGVGSDREFPY